MDPQTGPETDPGIDPEIYQNWSRNWLFLDVPGIVKTLNSFSRPDFCNVWDFVKYQAFPGVIVKKFRQGLC